MKKAERVLSAAVAIAVSGFSVAARASLVLEYDPSPTTPGSYIGGNTTVSGPSVRGGSANHFDDGNTGTGNLASGITTGQTLGSLEGADGSITFAAWVNLDSNANATDSDNMVFGSSGGNPIHLGFRNGNAWFGGWSNDSNASGGAPFAAWHHFIWVQDASGGAGATVQTIYEDGAQIEQTGGKNPFGQTGETVEIGTTGANNGDLLGSIADARIYNNAVDAAGALAIFNSSSQPVPEPVTCSVLATGAAGLLLSRRRRK